MFYIILYYKNFFVMLNLLKKKQSFKDVNKKIILSEKDKLSLSSSETIISSPSWKEWTNSIFCYNKQNIKLSVHKDKLVNYLFKSYFNLTKKILNEKRRRFNPNRFSSNRLFLSEAEIKHTNTNVNITLFLFNKNKNFLKYKLSVLQTKMYKLRKYQWTTLKNKLVKISVFNAKLFKSNLYRQIFVFFYHIKSKVTKRINILFNLSKDSNLHSNTKTKILAIIKNNVIKEEQKDNYWRNLFFSLINKKKKLIKVNKLKKNYNSNIYSDRVNKIVNSIYLALSIKNSNLDIYRLKSVKPITLLNKKNFKIYKYLYYYQNLLFNKNKFTNWFLNYRGFGIINIISKIYNKKVEFNIVNLKSIHLNSNIYSESIALKLRNRRNRLLTVLKKALFKVKLPRLFDLYNIDQKTLGFILNKKDVINSMKYKLVSGVRFEASGRLTRRMIASRAIFKFRYVGSLKNIYSSFVGLPSVMLRGYLKSNIQYTMINSKTRNGAFGLKGWTSSY